MKTNPKKTLRQRGFALIVTLTLMILLTVVAVGLLTLSSITLRSTSQGAAQAIASSNARLALMLAIGDLQKSLGPDQRISANASSLNLTANLPLQPNVVGAWDSLGWQGPSGNPPMPSEKAAKFRNWLVSTQTLASATTLAFPNNAEISDSIWLTNPATTGTIAPSNTRMKAERVPMNLSPAGGAKSVGGLAWMVSDNSSKVPLNLQTTNSVQLSENIGYRQAPAAPRIDVLKKGNATGADSAFTKITDPKRVISMQTAVLALNPADKKEINARTQSLTTSSLGLLTNTISGGLRTDLTPLFEGGYSNFTTGLGSAYPYFTANDGGPSWAFLKSHYLLYRRVTTASAGTPHVRVTSNDLSPASPSTTAGIQPKPAKEILLPVIAKLQIIFSLVSHYSHISDRITAFDSRALPLGNKEHAVPHLVYDPVITLYNPYDVELDLDQIRIRVWDPPVGFQFQKHDKTAGTSPWYRDDFASGAFHGLARFQIANETKADARKTFTLYLRAKSPSGAPGTKIVLLPGEVKVFSPWVETNWNWGLEAGNGYNPRSFFDWDNSLNMGNEDRRTYHPTSNPTGSGRFGVEGMPGIDFRAGLQTDHLSYGFTGTKDGVSGRSLASMYPWEKNSAGTAPSAPFGAGWLSEKLTDDVTVNAKAQRCVTDATLPDFRVDILAASNVDPLSDILRTYEFRLKDVPSEMSTTTNKIITRRFKVGDLLQKPADPDTAGKSPFAIFTMSAKTTKDSRDDSKAWLFNNMVTEGSQHDSDKIGNAAQSYDLRLQEVGDFTSFPMVEYDAPTQRGYFGAIASGASGVSIVPMYRVPITPAASLGDWVAANLITSSQFPRVNYALGNSFAHPLIPSEGIKADSPMPPPTGQPVPQMLDHSYLMNATFWDGYYFSSAANYTTPAGVFSPTRTKSKVLSDFFRGDRSMLNSRLVPYIAGGMAADALATKYNGASDISFAKEFGKNAMIQGAFNINSDSLDAWRAVLSSLRDASVKGYGNLEHKVPEKTAFVRNGMPIAGSADDINPLNTANVKGQIRWAGFRTLTDAQIEDLAKRIVDEIRIRGKADGAPSLCIADFVNRRLGASADIHARKGILQTAIDNSTINNNANFHALDSRNITGASLAADRVKGLNNKAALDGFTADGAAPMLTQGDLLTALAPIITARGDTFTIRSYGESRNGTTVVARAWCEATVQRIPEYVDTSNAPETVISALSTTNKLFGRRFVITSFRWLDATEI